MRVLRAYRAAAKLGDQRAQSLVETALVLPVLLLLLVGIADFGWMAYNYIELANAANAGAHYAAQSVTAAAKISSIQLAMTSDAANLSGMPLPSVSMTCTCSDGTAGVSCANYAACNSPARLIDTVTVTAQATVSPLINFPGIPSSVTMHSSATMQVEQ